MLFTFLKSLILPIFDFFGRFYNCSYKIIGSIIPLTEPECHSRQKRKVIILIIISGIGNMSPFVYFLNSCLFFFSGDDPVDFA